MKEGEFMTREEFIEKTKREGWDQQYVDEVLALAAEYESGLGKPYCYEIEQPPEPISTYP